MGGCACCGGSFCMHDRRSRGAGASASSCSKHTAHVHTPSWVPSPWPSLLASFPSNRRGRPALRRRFVPPHGASGRRPGHSATPTEGEPRAAPGVRSWGSDQAHVSDCFFMCFLALPCSHSGGGVVTRHMPPAAHACIRPSKMSKVPAKVRSLALGLTVSLLTPTSHCDGPQGVHGYDLRGR